MKSIKPGRGPSMMGGVMSVVMVVFGIGWTAATFGMGAPGFFPFFGVVFVGVGIFQAVYNFRNATGKDRYSAFDITDDEEEPDPLNERFGGRTYRRDDTKTGVGGFCPYCGAETASDYEFCRKCGKKL